MTDISRVSEFMRGDVIGSDEWELEIDNIITGVNTKFPLAGGTITGPVSTVGDFNAQAELLGDIEMISLGGGASMTISSSDRYISRGVSSTGNVGGVVANRAGSLVYASIGSICTSFSSSVTYDFEITVNGVSVVTVGAITHTATGVKTSYGDFTRGDYAIAAGDYIGGLLDITSSGSLTAFINILVGVQFDT